MRHTRVPASPSSLCAFLRSPALKRKESGGRKKQESRGCLLRKMTFVVKCVVWITFFAHFPVSRYKQEKTFAMKSLFSVESNPLSSWQTLALYLHIVSCPLSNTYLLSQVVSVLTFPTLHEIDTEDPKKPKLKGFMLVDSIHYDFIRSRRNCIPFIDEPYLSVLLLVDPIFGQCAPRFEQVFTGCRKNIEKKCGIMESYPSDSATIKRNTARCLSLCQCFLCLTPKYSK